jgi:hypothetical protein
MKTHINTQLAALRSQVAELERDKARIEFLGNHPESMPYLEDGIWRIPYLSQGEGGFGGGVSSCNHRTLSGCIDAVMARDDALAKIQSVKQPAR